MSVYDYYTSPYQSLLAGHPVFSFRVKNLRWVGNFSRLKRYNLLVALVVHGLVRAIWLGAVMGAGDYERLNRMLWMIGVMIGVGWGANFFIDLASLTFSLNSISGEQVAGRWDLLRLTALPEVSIALAVQALAQVRAWRVMVWVTAIRVAAFELMLILLFAAPLFDGDTSYSDYLRSWGEGFADYPLELILVIASVVVFWVVYIFDPLWRMRAMVTLGMGVSARIRSTVFGFLAAFFMLLCVWVGQLMFVGIVVWLLIQLFSGISSSFGVAFALFASICVIAWALYQFYRWLYHGSLNYTMRRAFPR